MNEPRKFATALDDQIDRLKFQLQQFEQGGVRYGQRTGDEGWQDRTQQTIHDQRNLVAVLGAIRNYLAARAD